MSDEAAIQTTETVNVEDSRNPVVKFVLVACRVAGSIPFFVLGMVALAYVLIQLPIEGFAKWNTGIGLAFNSISSDVELVTGLGSMVLLELAHHHRKAHRRETASLHAKIDSLHAKIDGLG